MKTLFYRLLFLSTLNCLNIGIFAQKADTVSLDSLLNIALENNFGIKISRNNLEINSLNNNYGKAGFSPKLDLGLSNIGAINSNRIEYFDNAENINNEFNTNTLDAFVQLNWTIFDGTGMFVRKSRLSEIEHLSDIELRSQIEEVYLQLSSMYFQLVRQQKLVQVLKYTTEISRFRLNLADKKFKLGAGSEIDRIHAEFDFNTDSALIIQQEIEIRNLKTNINAFLGRAPETDFWTVKEISISENLNYEDLKKSLLEHNSGILAQAQREKIRKTYIKENQTSYFPSVSLYADYEYLQTDYSAGGTKMNRIAGPSAGVKLSYTIFNGLQKNRSTQIARIEFDNEQLRTRQTINDLSAELFRTFNIYEGALKQIELETNNLEDARKNFQLAVRLYQLGSINELEFREIQKKEFESENRLLSALFVAKTAEIMLMYLSGQLMNIQP